MNFLVFSYKVKRFKTIMKWDWRILGVTKGWLGYKFDTIALYGIVWEMGE